MTTSRRRSAAFPALVVGVATIALLLVAVEPAHAAVPSGFEGGGKANVVAVDPHDTGIVVAGGDIAGIQVGSANGAVFAPRNAGAQFLPDMSVATVVFATQTTDLYAGTGNGSQVASGFWRSQDGGQTWTRMGTGDVVPDFAGQGVPDIRPRSTGELIALDESTIPDGHPANIYAGTTTGVMRSTDGGTTWGVIGLADVPRNLRGVALDPSDPAVLYVASYNDGVYVSTNANAPDPASVVFTQISGSPFAGTPAFPEELLVLSDENGSSLYVAAAGGGGEAGLYEYRGGSWFRLGQGALTPGSWWYSIDGYSSGGVRHLLVGCHGTCPYSTTTGLYQSLWRSDDGGATWTSALTSASSIHSNQIGGPGGPPWWCARRNQEWMLGGQWYKAAHIAIDPTDPRRIFLAGSQGVWRTEDAGANWYPVVNDLMVGSSFGVAIDANKPGRIYTASVDFGMVFSTDHGVTVNQSRPAEGGTNGTAVGVDPVTGRVYLSLGRAHGQSHAQLYSSADPSIPGTWVSERLAEAPGEGSQRADGLAISHTQYPVIVAGVVGSGIWRKVVRNGPGSGLWQQVYVEPAFGIEVRASTVYGSSLVYVYDHTATGELLMSNDGGQTWDSIWTQPSPPGMTGFIAADPTDPTRIYVSTSSGLYVITDTTGTPIVTQLVSMPDPTPGPVAVQEDGVVWVAGKTGDAEPSELYRSTDGGATWAVVGDDYYRNTAQFPHAMVVDPDGYLFLALRGNAMIVNPPFAG